jgi:hypothetical protein
MDPASEADQEQQTQSISQHISHIHVESGANPFLGMNKTYNNITKLEG